VHFCGSTVHVYLMNIQSLDTCGACVECTWCYLAQFGSWPGDWRKPNRIAYSSAVSVNP